MPAALSPLDELVRLLVQLDPDALEHWYGPDADPTSVAAGLAGRLRAEQPAHRGPGRPPGELPDWAITQLSEQGHDPGDCTHFFAGSDGRTIAAAVNGRAVQLRRG